MADEEGTSLSRRLHGERESEPDADADPGGGPWSEAESWDDEVADDARTEAVPTSAGAVAAGPSFERRQLDRMDEEALDRRRQLWRDTSLLLSGLLVVLIVANIVLPQLTGTGGTSPTAIPTSVVAGGVATPAPSSGATPEPLAAPSPSPEVSPAPASPAPAITQPPTGTAAPTRPGATPHPTTKPTPRPTPRPTSTPAPTPAPTPTPTPAPTPTPTPTPEITPEPPPAPTADFQWSQDGLTTTVLFSDASTGQIDAWSWDFGDSTSSSQQSPSHDYGAVGTWQVTLTVTGPGGSNSVTKTVVVA